MASITVPAPVVLGLSKVASLSEESFKEFFNFLEGIPLRIRQSDIFDDSGIQIDSIPADDFLAMKQGIFSLFIGRTSTNVPTETFVDDVIEYLSNKKIKNGEWIESQNSRETLGRRLKAILNIGVLNTLAKAFDLLTENAHTYSRSRVLSDIRPVFGEILSGPPQAAIIVHTLNISYFEAGTREEFTVALDSTDVRNLIETLERAEEKNLGLATTVSSSGMSLIEVV